MKKNKENYKTASYFAELWNLSERSVRNYCANNRIPGAVLKNGVWFIPSNAVKPNRLNKSNKKIFFLTEY